MKTLCLVGALWSLSQTWHYDHSEAGQWLALKKVQYYIGFGLSENKNLAVLTTDVVHHNVKGWWWSQKYQLSPLESVLLLFCSGSITRPLIQSIRLLKDESCKLFVKCWNYIQRHQPSAFWKMNPANFGQLRLNRQNHIQRCHHQLTDPIHPLATDEFW